jgi:hypothetical protein
VTAWRWLSLSQFEDEIIDTAEKYRDTATSAIWKTV